MSKKRYFEENKKRECGFDILKCVAAFMVVCIHCPFPGDIGVYFGIITRIAVPIFFMITGYYYHIKENENKELGQIKKIFNLLICSNLLYVVWNVVVGILASEEAGWFGALFSPENLLKFLLFNESPFASHLWYLGAILYVLIIVYSINRKYDFSRVAYWLLGLLLIDLILGKYSILLFNTEFPYYVARNFLFVGVPYFSLGYLLNNAPRYSNRMLVIFSVMFVILSFFEHDMLIYFDFNTQREHYISTTLLAGVVFLLFRNFDKRTNSTIIVNLLSNIGRCFSTEIYIIHPILVMGGEFVAKKIGVWSLYQYIAPFIVFGGSIMTIAVYRKLLKSLEGFIVCRRKNNL